MQIKNHIKNKSLNSFKKRIEDRRESNNLFWRVIIYFKDFVFFVILRNKRDVPFNLSQHFQYHDYLSKPGYSKRYNCIFVHIPKCAGTSISHVIFGHSGEYFSPTKKIWIQHATIEQLKEYNFNSIQWDNCFKFTFVRNPYDRLFSSYKWISKEKDLWNGKELELNKSNFKDFVFRRGVFQKILDKNFVQNEENRYHQVKPQFEYIFTEGKQGVDFIGKFENLQNDWSKIVQILNLKSDLPQINKGEDLEYKEFYDEETIQEVQRVYRQDLEFFNYNF